MSPQRNDLKPETIELLKCLKLWFRLGIFTKQDLYVIVEQLKNNEALEALEEAMNERD